MMIIILIAYVAFLISLAAFGGSAVYHAVRFGFPGDQTRLAVGIYLVTVTLIVVLSFIALGAVNLTEAGF